MELLEVEKELQTLKRESELMNDKLSDYGFVLNYTKTNGTVYRELVASLESALSDEVLVDGFTAKPSTTYVREVSRDLSKGLVELVDGSINETINKRMVIVDSLLKELESNLKKINNKSNLTKKTISLSVTTLLETSLLDVYEYPLPQLLKERKGLVLGILGDIKKVTKNISLVKNNETPNEVKIEDKYDFLLYSQSDLQPVERLLESESNINDGYYRLANAESKETNPYIETLEVPIKNLINGLESDLLPTVKEDLKDLIRVYGKEVEEDKQYSLDNALVLKSQYEILDNLTILLSTVVFVKAKISSDFLELLQRE